MKSTIIKYINYSFLSLSVMASVSCQKFFEVERDKSTNRPPIYTDDYESMLNRRELTELDYLLPDFLTDDIYLSDQNRNVSTVYYMHNAYLWNSDIWINDDQDVIYKASYQNILQLNIVISKVLDSPGGTLEEKERLLAEAKIQRAWHYLQLVNLYGPSYEENTAKTSLGVPLVTLPDADINVPKRATVQEIYDAILKDLNEATQNVYIPLKGKDLLHPGKLAGLALLSRTYLLMGDYQNALKYADEVLAIQSDLIDYSTFNENLPRILTEYQQLPTEVLFLKVSKNIFLLGAITGSLAISDDLNSIYNKNDFRYKLNFNASTATAKATYKRYNNTTTLYSNMSVTVPELMLIKAECLARSGKNTEAVALINELSKHRFSVDNFVPFEDNGDVLKLILDERRRELFFHGGLRLFDLKRLNRDNKYQKTIERKDNKGNIIATLTPNSNRYLMPIAPIVIFANPNIVQNER